MKQCTKALPGTTGDTWKVLAAVTKDLKLKIHKPFIH
jgi:hypothetical protein